MRRLKRFRNGEEDSSVGFALWHFLGENCDAEHLMKIFSSFLLAPDSSPSELVAVTHKKNLSPLFKDMVFSQESLTLLCAKLNVSNDALVDFVYSKCSERNSKADRGTLSLGDICFAFMRWHSRYKPSGSGNRQKNLREGNIPESSPVLMYYKNTPGLWERLCKGVLSSGISYSMEWDAFYCSLSTALPMTFRLHYNDKALHHLSRHHLHNHHKIPLLKDTCCFSESDVFGSNCSDRRIDLLPCSGWWSFKTGELYSCQHEIFHDPERPWYSLSRTFHMAGAASFQEIVSTLPVRVLRIQSDHLVLDMCAAPGSKSLHALDNCQLDHRPGDWGALLHSALLFNEKNRIKATQTLSARVKRYHAPNAIVLCSDATKFPHFIKYTSHEPKTIVPMKMDRVICDVPCSGDGTIRKNHSVCSTWTPEYVNSLRSTQLALLRRAIHLTKIGGYVVYSTCSLSPWEDEAVVNQVMAELNGTTKASDKSHSHMICELVNIQDNLRAVITGREYETLRLSVGVKPEEADNPMYVGSSSDSYVSNTLAHDVTESNTPKLNSLWSNTDPAIGFDPSCVVRIMPHRADTGGFFMALLRKVSEHHELFPSDSSISVPRKWHFTHFANHKRYVAFGHFQNHDEKILWNELKNFYGFSDERTTSPLCPTIGGLYLMYHLPSADATFQQCRRLVLVTKAVWEVLKEFRLWKGPGVELISAGVRTFERYDPTYLPYAPCRWRIAAESASWIARYVTNRKICLNLDAGSSGYVTDSDFPSHLLSVLYATPPRVFARMLLEMGQTSLEAVHATPATFLENNPKSVVSLDQDINNKPNEEWKKVCGGVLIGFFGGNSGLESDNPWWFPGVLTDRLKVIAMINKSLRSFAWRCFFFDEPLPSTLELLDEGEEKDV